MRFNAGKGLQVRHKILARRGPYIEHAQRLEVGAFMAQPAANHARDAAPAAVVHGRGKYAGA